MLQCTSQLLFWLRYSEIDFMIAKFSCSESIGDVSGTYPWWNAMLVKLKAFIPQFN